MAATNDAPAALSAPLALVLAAHTSDFVGVIDESGVALYMNKSARGALRADVEGKTLEEFLSPARATRIRAMVATARESGEPVIEEAVRIDALDGSERWFVEKCVPFREADGALRFLLVRTETTHLRRAEQELRASEARYRTLFESNPDPVVVVDVSTLQIAAANPAAVRLYGYSEEELLSRTWVELSHEGEREAIDRAFRSNPAGERRTRVRQLRRDGAVIVAEIVDNPIAIGKVTARMAVVRDLTERELVEKQLRHAQKMEAMAVFAGGVAHDFNNLLAIITACAEGLRRALPTEQSEELTDLRDATVRGTNLTKKLMLFCRHLVLDTAVLDLVHVVDKAGGAFARLLGEGVRLTVEHRAPSALVVGDPVELEQVVGNLVVNAGQAITGRGQVTVRTSVLEVDASYASRFPRARPGRYAELSVEDDGQGMDEATLARVFEPFFTTKAQGTGLGLAVVHGVVERHGGFLRAESRPGVGTSITAYLPLADAPRAEAIRTAPPITTSVRLLVADDEPVVLKALERMLRRLGYDVVSAADGEAACLAFESDPDGFALVVLDIMMPKLKGPGALARMRALRPAVPALLITGYAGQLPPETRGSAPVRVLQKPFSSAELSEEIQRILAAPTSRV
ncbi:MAG: PAS domain S-box protein [Myxococcales bacterium]|nr:PAS domain S-box protein [Myxococcales bacterium]